MLGIIGTCLFIALSLPEGFDQRCSFGIIWIGNYSIHPADLLSFAILFLALLSILFNKSIVRSRFSKPLMLLTVVLIVQGLRGVEFYEIRDVIKDLRSIAPWLCIFALPQLFRSVSSKERWVKWGIFIVLIPPLLVTLFSVIRFLIFGPFITFGWLPERIRYVNGDVLLVVAMSGVAVALTNKRKYTFVFGLSSLLLAFQLALSKSRTDLLCIVIVYALFFSYIKHRAIFVPKFVVVLMITLIMIRLLIPYQTGKAINRFITYSNVESFTSGHDMSRVAHMSRQFNDFLHNPIVGTGLGKPYYCLFGVYKGYKASSPSDSFFINLSAKTGIFGVGAVIWILLLYWQLLRKLSKDESCKGFSILERSFVHGLLITFPVLIIGNIVGNSLWHYRTPPLQLAVMISVIEILASLQKHREVIEKK